MADKNIKGYLSSFFKEEIIERFPSAINPVIEVAIINGRYQLNAGNVNYSFGPLHDAFRKYFRKDPLLLTESSKVLILGFGAGSVASIIHNEYNINCSITGVDADPAVIQAANKYFDLQKDLNTEVVISDAYDFIKNCEDSFDLIIVDIYIDDKVPPLFESHRFIRLLHKATKPGGKTVFNKLHNTGFDDTPLKVLSNYFRTEFPRVQIHKISVNKSTPNYFITALKSD